MELSFDIVFGLIVIAVSVIGIISIMIFTSLSTARIARKQNYSLRAILKARFDES